MSWLPLRKKQSTKEESKSSLKGATLPSAAALFTNLPGPCPQRSLSSQVTITDTSRGWAARGLDVCWLVCWGCFVIVYSTPPTVTTRLGSMPIRLRSSSPILCFSFDRWHSGVTFIPVFNERLSAGNKESAWRLSYSMINFMALTTLVASVLIIIFADVLIKLLWPALDRSGHGLAVQYDAGDRRQSICVCNLQVSWRYTQAIGRFTFLHFRHR